MLFAWLQQVFSQYNSIVKGTENVMIWNTKNYVSTLLIIFKSYFCQEESANKRER